MPGGGSAGGGSDDNYVHFGCVQRDEEGEGEVEMLEVQARLGKIDFSHLQIYVMHAGTFVLELTVPDFPEINPCLSDPLVFTQAVITVSPPSKPAMVNPKVLTIGARALLPGSVCGEHFEGQPVVEICDQLGEKAIGPISNAMVVLRITKRPNGLGSFHLDDPDATEVHLQAEGARAEFERTPQLLTTCGMYELSAYLEDFPDVPPGLSGEFEMKIGPPAMLTFTELPREKCENGLPFKVQPVISIRDKGGNICEEEPGERPPRIELFIKNGPEGGSFNNGNMNLKMSAVKGIADFVTKQVALFGGGKYILGARVHQDSTTDIESKYPIIVAPASIEFQKQPMGSRMGITGGIEFWVQPVVRIHTENVPVVGDMATANVTLTVQSGPEGGSFNGMKSVTLACNGGIADFRRNRCALDKAGRYVIAAMTDDYPLMIPATTIEFEVTPGVPNSIEVERWPTSTVTRLTVLAPFPVQPRIVLRDKGHNVVTRDSSSPEHCVALEITKGPKGGKFVAHGSQAKKDAFNGVADYSQEPLTLDRSGTYSFVAFIDDWRYCDKCRVKCDDITVGPAFLEFTQTPGPAGKLTGGVNFPQQPLVSLVDVNGNLIDSNHVMVTMRILSGPKGGSFGVLASKMKTVMRKVKNLTMMGMMKSGQAAQHEAASPTKGKEKGKAKGKKGKGEEKVAESKGPQKKKKKAVEVSLQLVDGVADFSRKPLMLDLKGCYELIAFADDDPDLVPCRSGEVRISSGEPVSLVFHRVPSLIYPCATEWSERHQALLPMQNQQKPGKPQIKNVRVGALPAQRAAPPAPPKGGRRGSLHRSFGVKDPSRKGMQKANRFDIGEVSDKGVSACMRPEWGRPHYETRLVVQARDAGGNIAERFPVSVKLSILSGPPMVSFKWGEKYAQQTGMGGVVDFTHHPLLPAGSLSGMFVLRASLMNWEGIKHDSTDIHFCPARLDFHTMPGPAGNVTGGSPFVEQPKIAVLDANGDIISEGPLSTLKVTLSITKRPAAGGNFGGGHQSVTTRAKNGVADFTDQQLLLDVTGLYELTATADQWPGVRHSTSGPFTVDIGRPHSLSWEQQPGPADELTGGILFPVQPIIAIRDPGYNIISYSRAQLIVSIEQGPKGGQFVQAEQYTRDEEKENQKRPKANQKKEEAAARAGILGTSQRGKKDVHSAKDGLHTNMLSVRVSGRDDQEEETKFLPPRNIVTLVSMSGVANFAKLPLALNVAGEYVLKAAIVVEGVEISSLSDNFAVLVGPPAIIEFHQVPGPVSTLTDHCYFKQQPILYIRDAGRNMVCGRDGDQSQVKLRVISGPKGGTFGNLSDTSYIRASMGIGNFARSLEPLLLTFPGTYVLGTSLDAWPAVIECKSGPVQVESCNAFFVQNPGPQGAHYRDHGGRCLTGGRVFPHQPIIEFRDVEGNRVETGPLSEAQVALRVETEACSLMAASGMDTSIFVNPELHGNTVMDATEGIADFCEGELRVRESGRYLAVATVTVSGSKRQLVSRSPLFTIVFGPPAGLEITPPEGSITGGLPFEVQPIVYILDAGGNIVLDSTETVMLQKLRGPGELFGAASMRAVEGIADFCDSALFIDKVGKYVLQEVGFSSPEGPIDPALKRPSPPFRVVPGPVSQLNVLPPEGSITGGTPFAVQPVVLLADAGGNTVSGAELRVTIWKDPRRGRGNHLSALTGQTEIWAKKGVADFVASTLAIDVIGDYQLCASTDTGTQVIEGKSRSFTVVEGPPAVLYLVPPGIVSEYDDNANVTGKGMGTRGRQRHLRSGLLIANYPFELQPKVRIEDAGGNTITSGEVSCATVHLRKKSGLGQLLGTTTLQAINGIADFGRIGDLSFDLADR
jgi:hypothetical protein